MKEVFLLNLAQIKWFIKWQLIETIKWRYIRGHKDIAMQISPFSDISWYVRDKKAAEEDYSRMWSLYR